MILWWQKLILWLESVLLGNQPCGSFSPALFPTLNNPISMCLLHAYGSLHLQRGWLRLLGNGNPRTNCLVQLTTYPSISGQFGADCPLFLVFVLFWFGMGGAAGAHLAVLRGSSQLCVCQTLPLVLGVDRYQPHAHSLAFVLSFRVLFEHNNNS